MRMLMETPLLPPARPFIFFTRPHTLNVKAFEQGPTLQSWPLCADRDEACAALVARLPKAAALVLRRMVLEFGAKRAGPPNITAWHSRFERQHEKTDADLTSLRPALGAVCVAATEACTADELWSRARLVRACVRAEPAAAAVCRSRYGDDGPVAAAAVEKVLLFHLLRLRRRACEEHSLSSCLRTKLG